MGFEENAYFRREPSRFMDKVVSGQERDLGEEEAARNARIRKYAAQADALRVLADLSCPESVKEFGRLHNIPTFAEVCWLSAFEAGYAAGLARLRDREAPLDANPKQGDTLSSSA